MVEARDMATIDAVSLASAKATTGALVAVSFSGAGADATNVILSSTKAYVQGSHLESAAGVKVLAVGTSVITATITSKANAEASVRARHTGKPRKRKLKR